MAGGTVGRQKIAQSQRQIGPRPDHPGGTGGTKPAIDRPEPARTRAIEDGRSHGGRLHRVAGTAGAFQTAAQKSHRGEPVPQAIFGSAFHHENLGFGAGILIRPPAGDVPAFGVFQLAGQSHGAVGVLWHDDQKQAVGKFQSFAVGGDDGGLFGLCHVGGQPDRPGGQGMGQSGAVGFDIGQGGARFFHPAGDQQGVRVGPGFAQGARSTVIHRQDLAEPGEAGLDHTGKPAVAARHQMRGAGFNHQERQMALVGVMDQGGAQFPFGKDRKVGVPMVEKRTHRPGEIGGGGLQDGLSWRQSRGWRERGGLRERGGFKGGFGSGRPGDQHADAVILDQPAGQFQHRRPTFRPRHMQPHQTAARAHWPRRWVRHRAGGEVVQGQTDGMGHAPGCLRGTNRGQGRTGFSRFAKAGGLANAGRLAKSGRVAKAGRFAKTGRIAASARSATTGRLAKATRIRPSWLRWQSPHCLPGATGAGWR